MTAQHRLAPILVAVAAIFLLAVMDGAMKGASLAVGAYSAMLWRGVVGLVLTLPLWRYGASPWPRPPALKIHLLRGINGAIMAVLFFHSITLLPLAQAIAISFFAPIIALFLAAATLGERVSPSSIVASLVGFAGVVIVCWPEFTGTIDPRRLEGIAAILGSALLYAVHLVLARRQAQLAPPREIAFFGNAISLLALLPLAPWLLARPEAATFGWIALSSLLSVTAALLLAWAYARAEAQVLVPMEYSAFVWAAIIGWLAFAEALSATTLVGVVLIVAACLYSARRAAPEPVAA